MLQPARLNITIDGQFGSTGKGTLNSYLAAGDAAIDIALSNAAPNAGHTFVDAKGEKQTCYHLPVSGVLRPDARMYLCAGSIVDPELLSQEMAHFDVGFDRLCIHPRACILLPEHKAREAEQGSGATKLASTRKGVGAALADKVARVPGPRTAAEHFGASHPAIGNIDLMAEMDKGRTVLMEVPQGFGLSINHGLSYPHCTSRDITVSAALNDAGVHPRYLGRVIAALRSYPIRVGHIVEDGREVGNSGPFYPDSVETDWASLGLAAELTTVTKRVRRVATFSALQYAEVLRHLRPDAVFVNFVNYFRDIAQLEDLLARMQSVEEEAAQHPQYLIGLGPAAADVLAARHAPEIWQALQQRRKAS